MKPWEKYQNKKSGPWDKYSKPKTQQVTRDKEPSFMPGYRETQQKMWERPDLLKQATESLDPRQFLTQAAQKIAQGGASRVLEPTLSQPVHQRLEAGLSNPSVAMQTGEFNPRVLLDEMYKGMMGEKLGEFGDVYRNLGMPEYIAAPLGMINMYAAYQLGGMALKKTGIVDKSFRLTKKTYNRLKPKSKAVVDKQLSDTGEAMVQKAMEVKELKGVLYDKVYSRNDARMVSADSSKKMLNSGTAKLKKMTVDDYSTGLVDAKGNPVLNIKGLRRLNTKLAQMEEKPDLLGRIKPEEIVTYKRAVKEAILESMPKEHAAIIRRLDVKYGPTMDAAESIIKAVKPKQGGPVNTNYLLSKFGKPQYAGERAWIRDLKKIDKGFDFTKEINFIERHLGKTSILKSIGQVGKTGGKVAIVHELLKQLK